MRKLPVDEIPDRPTIASYYVEGRIDEGAVIERDGVIEFIGHGGSGTAWWQADLGIWLWRFEVWCCQRCFDDAGCAGLYRFAPRGELPVKLF